MADNGVTMSGFSLGKSWIYLAVNYRFGRSRYTLGKVIRSSGICMTQSEEPRAVKSGLRLPNETDYSFAEFVVRNTVKPGN